VYTEIISVYRKNQEDVMAGQGRKRSVFINGSKSIPMRIGMMEDLALEELAKKTGKSKAYFVNCFIDYCYNMIEGYEILTDFPTEFLPRR
jgi:predicted DNA-binding protein